jgi:hypothetical protein
MTAFSHESDFAARVGKISAEYQTLTQNIPPDKKYEATLHLCLCQSLLTYCRERCKQDIAANECEELPDQSSNWGLAMEMVKCNTFCNPLTIGRVIFHLRNAVSHPTNVELARKYPSTGFKDIVSSDGYITSFAFIHSPDIRDTEFYYDQYHLDNAFKSGDFPCDAKGRHVRTTWNGKDLYQICVDEQPYKRVFRMDIPVDNLIQFVQQLSKYIASGVKNDRNKQ